MLIFFLTLLLTGCSTTQKKISPVTSAYKMVNFEQLKGWNNNEAIRLKASLLNSCKVFDKRSGAVSQNPLLGTYEQWHQLCKIMRQTDSDKMTAFFEKHFRPYQLNPNEKGLFTGYYTPTYHGSRFRSATFSTPLLKVPADLVRVNLKQFNHTYKKGSSIIYGKLKNNWLISYDNRSVINKRFKQGEYQHDVLCWLKNPVDRLFLQIQGSGYIQMPSGEKVFMQFASKNGRPYYPIGRYLKKNKLLKTVSMQTIKQWLMDNPSKAQSVINTNKSFVFFKESKLPPSGSLGVPVLANQSVAVDPHYIPLGFPVFIDTTLTSAGKPYQHAFAAQDTGSAIKGPVRADIYFGSGSKAGEYAGHQNSPGKMFILIPNK